MHNWQDLAKQRAKAAKRNASGDLLKRFWANQDRLYAWIHKLPKKSKELSWKRAGSLCCGTARTLQTP
jgi:long-subunit acyl-CoA synthetase (AMP-forming)